VAETSRVSRASGPERVLTNRYILVVDDDVDAREILSAVIGYHGGLVRAVPSARQALRLLRCMRPDVIVADIAMPNESGVWLVRRLRQRGDLVPMMAVTGLDTPPATLIEAGFDVAFTKPVDHARLIQTLRDLAGGAVKRRDRRVIPFHPVPRRRSPRSR